MNKKVMSSIIGIAAFSCSITPTAFAVTDSTDFSVTVNPYLNLTLSSADVHLPIMPSSGGTYGSASLTAYASTNNALGYDLNLSIKKDATATAALTTDLTSDTLNVNDGSYPVIPTLATADTLTASAFEVSTDANVLNHWGMSINDTDAYKAAVTESTVNTKDGPVADDPTVLNMATKLDLLTTPGSYSAYLNFELVAKVAPEPQSPIDEAIGNNGGEKKQIEEDIDGDGETESVSLYKMQDMTHEICASVPTPVESDYSDTPTTQLVDDRDNKVYWIAKLKDGNCYMTQNLDLNLSTSKELSYTDTDLLQGTTWTPPTNTLSSVVGYNSYGSDNQAASIDGGKSFWNKQTATTPTTDYENYLASTGDTHYHIGNYYTYSATIAVDSTTSLSTYTFDRSICPKGWTLPTISGGSRDMLAMLESYGLNTDSTLISNPIYPSLVGYVTAPTGITGAGNSTVFWTNTATDQGPMGSGIAINYDNTAQIASIPRFGAYSIRCVAR